MLLADSGSWISVVVVLASVVAGLVWIYRGQRGASWLGKIAVFTYFVLLTSGLGFLSRGQWEGLRYDYENYRTSPTAPYYSKERALCNLMAPRQRVLDGLVFLGFAGTLAFWGMCAALLSRQRQVSDEQRAFEGTSSPNASRSESHSAAGQLVDPHP